MAKSDSAPKDLLLDTHALLWWATSDRRLSRRVKKLIGDDDVRVFVSAATAWEIATKVRLGKLEWKVEESIEVYCIDQRFESLAVTFAHGELAGSWSENHGDPFDRMLAAQSRLESLPLATNDPKFELFDIVTVW